MSLFKKLLLFIAVVAGCTIASFLFLGIIFILQGGAADLFRDGDFTGIIKNFGTQNMKFFLAINHLFTFILASFLLSKLFSGKGFSRYANLDWNIDALLLLKLIGLLLLCYPIAGLAAAYINQIEFPSWMTSMDDNNAEILKDLLSMKGPVDLIINLIVIAIIPGIGEEMLFRGVMQNELQKKMKNIYLPLFIAAFIFAAFHLEPTGLITKFLIGSVLGYVYLLTKNILYPMIIHALNNGTQILMVYFSDLDKALDTAIPKPDLYQSLFAIFTIPLIYLFIKHLNKEYGWIKSSRHEL
jgi:uncharacterized protein